MLAACGGGDDPLTPEQRCDFAGTAAPGTANVQIDGGFSRAGVTRSGAWSTATGFGGLTVIDAFTVDGEGRPLSELFVFYDAPPTAAAVELVPVSLAQLLGTPPDGSFAFIAEAYNGAFGDYDRWLVSAPGCLVIDEAVVDDRIVARLKISGTWRSRANDSLGVGSVTATINAPLVTFRNVETVFRDSMRATLAGGRVEDLRAMTLDAFQVLHPTQTRLVIAGTEAADTTRELWLSIPGVPVTGDSIALDSVGVDEALSGRTAGPSAWLRLVVPGSAATITEIWPSTGGWVTFDRVVQTGPAALCAAAFGRFAFTARGTSLGPGGSRTSLGTMQVTGGRFATRYTPLMPRDTVRDLGDPPASPRSAAFQPAAPSIEAGVPRCIVP